MEKGDGPPIEDRPFNYLKSSHWKCTNMNATIIEEKGGHLLIASEDRFAVVERRNNRFYNCHDGKREGVAADDLSMIAQILEKGDWIDEATARAAFTEAAARYTKLAEEMR